MASHSLPDTIARKLEPWDLQNLVPYQPGYLSGFKSETYQVGIESGFEEAKGLMDPAIHTTICRDIGGDEQRISSVSTSYSDISFKHILLPIWISTYQYKSKAYRFLVNARTGEVQGERPWSFIKIALAVLTAIAIIAAGILIYQQSAN